MTREEMQFNKDFDAMWAKPEGRIFLRALYEARDYLHDHPEAVEEILTKLNAAREVRA